MINKAILMGRIGNKEFKTLSTGTNICKMSIATSKKYNDLKGEKCEATTWHNVNFYNKLAEIANNYAHVGDIIYLEGEIVNKKIDQNGNIKVFSSITGHEIKFLPSSKKQQYEPNGNIAEEEIVDDIPF